MRNPIGVLSVLVALALFARPAVAQRGGEHVPGLQPFVPHLHPGTAIE